MPHTANRSWWQNARMIAPIAIVHSLIYRHVTFHSLDAPWVLEPTWLDRRLPFWVWTVWPYLGMVFITFAPLLVRSPRVFRTVLLAYLIACSMALACYVFLPTAIDRETRAGEVGSLTWWLYLAFATGLGEGSCCPSGHIVFPIIGCWALYRDGCRYWWAASLFTAIASPSILLLKEHVAWDWLAGVACGAIAVVIAEVIHPSVEGAVDKRGLTL